MSTYSMNTGSLPTTSHMNQVKNRKVIATSKKALQEQPITNLKSQTRPKISSNEENLHSILKMYQVDIAKANETQKSKTGTNKSSNHYLSSSKHKTNTNLN